MVLIDLSKAFRQPMPFNPTLLFVNYRIWLPPTKLVYGSKVTLQTDNSSLVLQLHCQNHSLLHMACLRAPFKAQRFLACTWMIHPKSLSLVTSNLDTKMYFSFASKGIDSCLHQVDEDLEHVAEWCCKKNCKLHVYPRSTLEFIWTRLNVSVRSRSNWNFFYCFFFFTLDSSLTFLIISLH